MQAGWLMDIAGLGFGRGGTGYGAIIRNLMKSLQVTTHMQTGKRSILEQMHLLRPDGTPTSVVLDKKGLPYYSTSAYVEGIYDYVHGKTSGLTGQKLIEARTHALSNLSSAFGAQGGLFAAFASDAGWKLLEGYKVRMKKVPQTIDQAQREVLDTFFGQMQRATTGVSSFAAALASPQLGMFENALKSFANTMNRWTQWSLSHPGGSSAIMTGIESVVGLAASVVAVGLTRKIAGAVQGAFTALRHLFPNLIDGARALVRPLGDLGRLLWWLATPMRNLAAFIAEKLAPTLSRFMTPVTESIVKLVPWLGRLAPLFERLGLSFIPLAGWIYTAVEAFKLFRDHASDISWVLGKITGWMQYTLWPGVVDAVIAGWRRVSSALLDGLKGLWSQITAFFHDPRAYLSHIGADFGSWWRKNAAAFDAGHAAAAAASVPMLAGERGASALG
ncbi:MAG: hypothetical protein ACREQ5_18285, partial [Candidatus Dormibacteria bacterium]